MRILFRASYLEAGAFMLGRCAADPPSALLLSTSSNSTFALPALHDARHACVFLLNDVVCEFQTATTLLDCVRCGHHICD